jgi:hypothetical protein
MYIIHHKSTRDCAEILTVMGVDYLMYLSHTLTGPGLFALLAFSRVSHENTYLISVIAVSFLLSFSIAFVFPTQDSWTGFPNRIPRRLTLFAYILNNTFNLIVTIAVLLNVVSQIYPEQGREIALIPVYILLCCSRLCPSEIAYAVQGSLTVVFVLAMYFFMHSEKHARPGGESALDWITVLDVALTQIYASLQQRTGTFYTSREWQRPKWIWDPSKLSWYLNRSWVSLAVASLSRCVFYCILLVTRHAVVFHFLVPRSDPVQHYALVCYGSFLIFGCMLLGSSWFYCLRDLSVDVAGRNLSEKRVVRLQHVLYALVVAGAYIYPLQLLELRLALVSALLALSML